MHLIDPFSKLEYGDCTDVVQPRMHTNWGVFYLTECQWNGYFLWLIMLKPKDDIQKVSNNIYVATLSIILWMWVFFDD